MLADALLAIAVRFVPIETTPELDQLNIIMFLVLNLMGYNHSPNAVKTVLFTRPSLKMLAIEWCCCLMLQAVSRLVVNLVSCAYKLFACGLDYALQHFQHAAGPDE
jgi:hypothetical protein